MLHILHWGAIFGHPQLDNRRQGPLFPTSILRTQEEILSFTITHISPVQVKIDVQVPSDEVAASVKRVLQTVGRQARSAGFS